MIPRNVGNVEDSSAFPASRRDAIHGADFSLPPGEKHVSVAVSEKSTAMKFHVRAIRAEEKFHGPSPAPSLLRGSLSDTLDRRPADRRYTFVSRAALFRPRQATNIIPRYRQGRTLTRSRVARMRVSLSLSHDRT